MNHSKEDALNELKLKIARLKLEAALDKNIRVPFAWVSYAAQCAGLIAQYQAIKNSTAFKPKTKPINEPKQ